MQFCTALYNSKAVELQSQTFCDCGWIQSIICKKENYAYVYELVSQWVKFIVRQKSLITNHLQTMVKLTTHQLTKNGKL